MNYERIRINVGNGYDVYIGNGLIDICGELSLNSVLPCRAAIITDSNVAPLYLERAKKAFARAGFEVSSYVFPAGEVSKNLGTLSDILEFFAGISLTRADCVIALGGGVTGDIAGFAAGCYLRGIKYIQLPTTLLAAVDSSVGGKTAVNLRGGKNLAGLFIQPQTVICDVGCLSSLGKDIFADGAAEAIKTGILSGGKLFPMVENGISPEDISETICLCVKFKGSVVEKDELENGLRRTLNLGHTAAHAIEKCSGYAVTHGHAVAAGTAIMARAAEKLGYCTAETVSRIESALIKNGLSVKTQFSARELAAAALCDKKRSADRITLVFPEEIGSCRLAEIPVSGLEEIFLAGKEARI